MLPDLLAILGCGVMCGLWFVLQKTGSRPGGCASCSCGGGDGHCRREAPRDREPT